MLIAPPTPVLMALAAENKGITPVRGAYSTPTPRPIAQAMEDNTRHKVKGTYRYWNKMHKRKYEFFLNLTSCDRKKKYYYYYYYYYYLFILSTHGRSFITSEQ